MADMEKPDDGCALLALPQELRDKIYGTLMDGENALVFVNGCTTARIKGKPSLYCC